MSNADEYRPRKAAVEGFASPLLPAATKQAPFVYLQPSNDNVDDLAPLINLILAAGATGG